MSTCVSTTRLASTTRLYIETLEQRDLLALTVAVLDAQRIVQVSDIGVGSVFADAADGLFSPTSVTHDVSGNTYVADVLAGSTGRVFKFNSAGVGGVFADLADGVLSPTGLAFNASGALFVTNYLAGTVSKVTPAGVGDVFADAGDGLVRPFDVAVQASSGSVFVVDLDARKVLKFTPTGVGSVFADASDGLLTPIGIAVDGGGNVYVSDVLLGRVTKFNPAGVGAVFADAGDGLTSPAGMSLDAQGNLFVANYLSNTIVKVTPAGVGSLYADAASGLNRPFDVAINTATDNQPPTIVAGLTNDTGASATDGVTSDVTVGGTAVDNFGVTLFEAAVDAGAFSNQTAALGPGGVFTFIRSQLEAILGATLSQGAHTVRLRATDAAGNVRNVTVSLTLDTTAPPLPIFALDDLSRASPGLPFVTYLALVTLQGITSPGATVTLLETSQTTQASAATGVFTLTNVPVNMGLNSFRVRATDLAGNFSEATNAINRIPSPAPPSAIDAALDSLLGSPHDDDPLGLLR